VLYWKGLVGVGTDGIARSIKKNLILIRGIRRRFHLSRCCTRSARYAAPSVLLLLLFSPLLLLFFDLPSPFAVIAVARPEAADTPSPPVCCGIPYLPTYVLPSLPLPLFVGGVEILSVVELPQQVDRFFRHDPAADRATTAGTAAAAGSTG